MKILLFNLGTIEHRILNWGVEGFKTMFEQDVILWGPIPDKEFYFSGKEIPILHLFEPTTTDNLFKMLPQGWYPDIIACDTSVLNYIPDIYKSPVKTILFTRDSWSDTLFNRGLAEFFDFVNSSTIDRELYQNLNVNLLPLSGFAVSTNGKDKSLSQYEKRELDVIAIANYDNGFYHDRYRIFYKLSVLNKSGLKIRFFKRIKRSEIYHYYQRSKIIIDWAHTLSNRSYEAALNGCLLFSHEDNRLMNDFWTPWEEYIPYNEDNLAELILHYTNNSGRALDIIKKAQQRIKAMPLTWGEMAYEKIRMAVNTDVSIDARMSYNESTPSNTLNYRSATPLIYNYDYRTNFPSNWKELYLKRIAAATADTGNSKLRIFPMIEAARVSFLLREYDISLQYLSELEKIMPEYAWIYYLYGRIYFEQNKKEQALLALQRSLDCVWKSPELIKNYVLPVAEKWNACDSRRITSYMWQTLKNNENEFQSKTLLYLVFELQGIIYQGFEKSDEAVNSYTQAIDSVPVPDSVYRAAPILIKTRDYKKLYDLTLKGLDDSPYDSILVLYQAYALLLLNQKQMVYGLLRKHRIAMKSFVGIRKNYFIKSSMNIIIFLSFFGKLPGSMIIREIIKVLRRKAEMTYLDF